MVALTDVLQGLATGVSEALGNVSVYLGRMPEEALRPACLLRCGQLRVPGGIAAAYERREWDLSVILYPAEGETSYLEDVVAGTQAILGLMSSHYVRIGDRALTIASLTCQYNQDDAEVKATLAWSEEVSSAASTQPAEHLGLKFERVER